MKDAIVRLVAKEVGLKVGEVERLLEVPPKEEMGDFAFPCFVFSKKLKKNPMVIAEELAEKLRKDLRGSDISGVDFKGAYVNFFVDKKILAERVLKDGGKVVKRKGKRVIEFPSPNTNKPLHLGHLRNMAIGASVAKILEFVGNDVVRVNLNNDRGVHICKSMVGYEKFGEGAKPNKKSDHFVGDWYVKFNEAARKDKKLEAEALDCLKRWEAGDKETVALWKKMNKWAFDGFAETYGLFGVKFDKEYFESELYKKGKDIIAVGLKKGVFVKGRDGEVKIDLSKENLGEKVLLRADGTALYMVQDLYLAKLKDADFKVDGSIYVVGNEQNYHFRVLFAILEKLGFGFADKLYHLSYGMVNLPEGRMKSREGTIVDADDLIERTRILAEKGLVTRGAKLSKKELGDRSLKIALAAIKYNLLKIDIRKNMVFNPKEAIAFEGDTGPYLLYSYARASSIVRRCGKYPLRMAKVKSKKKVRILDLKGEEIALLKKIDLFGDVVGRAYESLAPNLVANYCYELASMFNEFYHACPVLGSVEEGFRLKLVSRFRETLGRGLGLLGIETIEEM